MGRGATMEEDEHWDSSGTWPVREVDVDLLLGLRTVRHVEDARCRQGHGRPSIPYRGLARR